MNVQGILRVPGDKSISHRALMLAALAEGTTCIRRILESADVHSTADALRALGVSIPPLSDHFTVRGTGRGSRAGRSGGGLHVAEVPIDCGNSGTTTRLMSGIVAGCDFATTFVGDESLSRRPMRRVAKPLEAMGARVELPAHGGLPMTVHGGALHGISWRSEVASAQVKSAILLAALVGGVPVSVEEPERTRDHTERMLAARGAPLGVREGRIELGAMREALAPVDTVVPGDPSSAAFFAALAALSDGGALALDDVCVNPTRTGFFTTLARMGAAIRYEQAREEGGEPIARMVVGPGDLRGVTVGREVVPSMIDELPMLACVAARAAGETTITGAAELRVKESDRIAAVVANLTAIGADAQELSDGLVVRGSRTPLRGRVRTFGDHRIAMAFGVLGALPGNDIVVDDPACTAVSYPAFWNDLERVCRA